MSGEVVTVGLITFLIMKELSDTSERGLLQEIGRSVGPWLVPLALVLLYMVSDAIRGILS